ncbi:MAG TPA: VOC family protein [Dehalococcoidia bacterium]|nr:VOC family protein [Dehalococcoidia bacterium]
MSRVTIIQHINIQISDRARTREWYERVLGAEFLDRGPELNKRQLQFRIGIGEIHTTDSPNPVPSGHWAAEIRDWDEMIANLDALGVPYAPPTVRAYSSGHSTYIKDPDGNMIELVQHPLGLADSKGKKVELVHDSRSLAWVRLPGYGPAT